MEKKKYVYLFKEGNASMRNLLGGKGANLAEMTILGIPVPQGFTVTTEACTKYYEDGKKISEDNQGKEANKTPKENRYYDNPDTQMHVLLQFLFAKVGINIDALG